MMLCSRCNKRPAVVFLSSTADGSNTTGYCLVCAKELGVKPVTDIMEKMGISEDDIDSIQEQMNEFADSGFMTGPDTFEGINDDDDDDDFSRGGAPTFPPFFKNLFGSKNPSEKLSDKEKKEERQDGGRNESRKKRSKGRKHIDAYCTNLTQKAADGELDRIIGRDKEIDRVVQILSRRTKNNPCLIGEPGVGKTAIAEGLALKIADGNVPHRLKDKEIQLLDLTSLVAGTQFRGQFESRIKGLITEVKEAGNIILFIDEVHSLVGAGDSEGSMNAANIMKPALSRGEIQVIGATTFSEYRRFIEKDAALERRFQPVTVSEPSIQETIEMLLGVKSYYEDYHRVHMPDDIVRKTVVISERYITDRFLPDKAIDLLDESCTHASLRNKDLEKYDSSKDKIENLKSVCEEMESEEDILSSLDIPINIIEE